MTENRAPELIDGGELTERQRKVANLVREIAQDYFQRESSGASLITITRASISKDMKRASIYMTVLPESKEAAALDFAHRSRSDLRRAMIKRLDSSVTPHIEIELDIGEKHRVHLDKLSRQIAKGTH